MRLFNKRWLKPGSSVLLPKSLQSSTAAGLPQANGLCYCKVIGIGIGNGYHSLFAIPIRYTTDYMLVIFAY